LLGHRWLGHQSMADDVKFKKMRCCFVWSLFVLHGRVICVVIAGHLGNQPRPNKICFMIYSSVQNHFFTEGI
jgi:hypothetical protein